MSSDTYKKEILPYYLMITDGCGISAEYIDNSCPADLEPYEIAYEMRLKRKDSLIYEWVGNYVGSAVIVAVDHCLNGRKARSEYLKEPLMKDKLLENEEEKINMEREKFVAGLMAMKANFELNQKEK